MTKDEAVSLGIAAEQARQRFDALGWQNIASDSADRAKQVKEYETARAEMNAAQNAHERALKML